MKTTSNKSFLEKHRRKLVTSILICMILAGLFFALPPYLRKAIIYGYTGIYDYKIFHNRKVNTESPQAWPVSKSYNIAYPSDDYIDSLDLMETTSYLVLKDDSLLFEYYAQEEDVSSISNSFSMAKSFVGLLVGCAIEDGYIKSIHQSIDQFIPELKNLRGKGLTIEHLLTMSSGTNWDEHYSSVNSITTKAYYGNDIKKLMQEVEVIEEPGRIFRYKSGDTQLLAIILTKATGKTLADYASEKLWKPMRAENPALWSLDKKAGMEKAYCCYNSTARDFARFGSLILHLGQWKGEQLVPQSHIIESITPASFLKDGNNKALTYYGYQWWIIHYRGMAIPYARGLSGQYIFILPTKNAVIVRLGHLRSDERINEHPLDSYTWINIGLDILEQQDLNKLVDSTLQ